MEHTYKKTALVTGASQGIGAAIARELAANDFAVVINYNKSRGMALDLERELKEKGACCMAIKADVSDKREVTAMVKSIDKRFGSLDVIVNNAGIIYNYADQTLENLKIRELYNAVNVNLYGSILTTKFCLPLLKRSKNSKIIFITSSLAFIGSRRRFAYVVSKSSVLGIVRALALELAPRGILVNAIVPGYIKTRMSQFSKKELQEKLKKIPLKRLGDPEEVAALVSFLASPRNTYITGQCIHLNGGLYFA